MACAKQLQAVQGFLRGIRALSTYEVTRERQFAQLEKGLRKLWGLTAAQAGALLGSVEEALWSASQVERMQELVAEKTREATYDMQSGDKPALQDFATLPYHLTEELWRAVDDAADRDSLLRQLCAHAGSLGLRFASEATKATLVALAHWRVLREGAVPAAEQHELYLRQKWKVCKCLGGLPPPGVHVVDLPLQKKDVPVELRLGELTGSRLSGARGRAAHEVCQFVRQMPLRKVHRSLQGDASSGRAAGAGTDSNAMVPLAAVCEMVRVCAGAARPQAAHVDPPTRGDGAAHDRRWQGGLTRRWRGAQGCSLCC